MAGIESRYIIYTDGGCRPQNPGPGGFGVVVFDLNGDIAYWYAEENPWTTNNIMELSAIQHAIHWVVESAQCAPAIIYTDSAYAMNCIKTWAPNSWSKNGWINSKKEPVKNADLIKSIYEYYTTNFLNCQVKGDLPLVDIQKVRGHVGVIGNELVDRLADGDFDTFYKIASQNDIKLL